MVGVALAYWSYRINFLQYGFAALMTNEFGGGGTGTAQLQMYSLAGDGLAQDTGFCVGVQAAILVVVLVITITALALVKHGSRKGAVSAICRRGLYLYTAILVVVLVITITALALVKP